MFPLVPGLICFEDQKRSDGAQNVEAIWATCLLNSGCSLLRTCSGAEFTGCIGCIGGLTGGGGFSTAGASSGWSPILFYGVGWMKAAATMWYQAKKKGDFE